MIVVFNDLDSWKEQIISVKSHRGPARSRSLGRVGYRAQKGFNWRNVVRYQHEFSPFRQDRYRADSKPATPNGASGSSCGGPK